MRIASPWGAADDGVIDREGRREGGKEGRREREKREARIGIDCGESGEGFGQTCMRNMGGGLSRSTQYQSINQALGVDIDGKVMDERKKW